jgi:hypothetical protein
MAHRNGAVLCAPYQGNRRFYVSLSPCAGNGAGSSVLVEAKASRTTKTWFSTPFGKVRAVSTPWGTGIRTSSKFSCPKPDQVLGSFGPIVLLSDDEYAASEWHDYGVAWSGTLTAVPQCRGRAELDDWGPLVNTASGECGERNNLRLHRAYAQQAHPSNLLLLAPAATELKHPPPRESRVLRSQMRGLSEHSAGHEQSLLPMIQLVSTRAIGGNEMLLMDYGREFSRALREKRAHATRLVNKHKKLKARRPFFQRLVCRRCGTPYAYRRQIVHFARDCMGVTKP